MALAVIDGRLLRAQAARHYGVSAKIVTRWVERFKAGGREAMFDRSSRPHDSPRQTDPALASCIISLRRQRLTGKHIALETGVSPATVSRVLKRVGLSRLKDIEPTELVHCYERQAPGEMIHIDIKKLGRFHEIGHRITGDRTWQSSRRGKAWGAGWEYVHVCIDDAPRIAFSQILPDEKKESAVVFLKAALAYYASLGIVVERVMTDNGPCYTSKAFVQACREHGFKHVRTRPYAQDQWKSRTLHPDRAERVGLCRRLSQLRHACRRTPAMAPSLQLAQASRQSKIKATYQSPRYIRGQPVEAPHLEPSSCWRLHDEQASHLAMG